MRPCSSARPADEDRLKLSVIIPAHDEAASIGTTVAAVVSVLEAEGIDYEVVVVDDASTDGTTAAAERAAAGNERIRCLRSPFDRGYGLAVRAGLERFTGDAVAIVMADGSDDPADLIRYYRLLEEGHDCVFGSRFVRGARVIDYPKPKLVINRAANWLIRLLFRHGYDDTTNAFKAYRREVIETVQPLLSKHFNLTIEMPLKAIIRGHSYAVIPISWRNRQAGRSKLLLQEMGSRYLFILLYAFLERHLSRGDYMREGQERPRRTRPGKPSDAVLPHDPSA